MNLNYWRSFSVLGVPPNSSNSVVKKAYRKIAGKNHPDRSSSPESTELFKSAVEAYDEIMRVRSLAPVQQHCVEASIADVVRGSTTQIEVPQMDLCDDCGGSGWEICTACEKCQSQGWVSNILFGRAICNVCRGYGWHGRAECKSCSGVGRKQTTTQELTVTIPPNSWSGRVVHEEDNVRITVSIKNEGYKLRGRLLSTDVDVPYETLLDGGSTTVNSPDGEVVVKIPPRTKPGTVLMLRGLGIPFREKRGDFAVKIGLLFPATSEDEEDENEE